METIKNTIVSCSGASNTGKYTDEIARRMSANDDANMLCLAKIAISDIALIKKTKEQTGKIIVLDGCPFNCAEKILAKEDIINIVHLNTTDFEIKKGITPVTDEKINEIIDHLIRL